MDPDTDRRIGDRTLISLPNHERQRLKFPRRNTVSIPRITESFHALRLRNDEHHQRRGSQTFRTANYGAGSPAKAVEDRLLHHAVVLAGDTLSRRSTISLRS